MDAFVESGGVVSIEAYFGDGKPVAHAVVRVRAEDGRELHAGATDADGRFTFKPAKAETVTVEVVQAGHKASAVISKDDLAAAVGDATAVGEKGPQPLACSLVLAPSTTSSPAADRSERSSRRAVVAGQGGAGTRIIAAMAGVALILAAAALWQVRSLSRRLDEIHGRAQTPSQRPTDHGPRTTDY